MERNTVTTLGALRNGDRFHFPKRVDIWEVTGSTRNHTSINLPGLNGVFTNKYDDLKKSSTSVVFMRHTQPLQGEQCLYKDLKPGDIFHMTNNIIDEFRRGADERIGHFPAGDSDIIINANDTVVFVRKGIFLTI
ncbi:hypothetical protein SAMN05428988_1333 [Chitinophaga sp. YR573]|uniref:hypothetical protein n=1 Tax=Chitinophaga sp. YR573 TaxID=1881040 RepID=UPI0008CC7B07|nr:hypothetical protein [Chitinophaga sp. YR573]SEW02147.1 hypothetical protein SAMN05428988_1333 [Chitinophaga sp. YR573]